MQEEIYTNLCTIGRCLAQVHSRKLKIQYENVPQDYMVKLQACLNMIISFGLTLISEANNELQCDQTASTLRKVKGERKKNLQRLMERVYEILDKTIEIFEENSRIIPVPCGQCGPNKERTRYCYIHRHMLTRSGSVYMCEYVPVSILTIAITLRNNKISREELRQHFRLDENTHVSPYQKEFRDSIIICSFNRPIELCPLRKIIQCSMSGNVISSLYLVKNDSGKHYVQNYLLDFYSLTLLQRCSDDTQTRSLYQCRRNGRIYECLEANRETIAQRILKLDPRPLRVIDKTFVYIRHVHVGEERVFLEPVYCQIKYKSHQETTTKKPNVSSTSDAFLSTDSIWIRVFYVSLQGVGNTIKSVLVKNTEMRLALEEICDEINANSQDYKRLVDRFISMKIRVDPKNPRNILHFKEYKARENVLLKTQFLLPIEEKETDHVRYNTAGLDKTKNKYEKSLECHIKDTKERVIVVEKILKASQIDEGSTKGPVIREQIFEPNLSLIYQDLLNKDNDDLLNYSRLDKIEYLSELHVNEYDNHKCYTEKIISSQYTCNIQVSLEMTPKVMNENIESFSSLANDDKDENIPMNIDHFYLSKEKIVHIPGVNLATMSGSYDIWSKQCVVDNEDNVVAYIEDYFMSSDTKARKNKKSTTPSSAISPKSITNDFEVFNFVQVDELQTTTRKILFHDKHNAIKVVVVEPNITSILNFIETCKKFPEDCIGFTKIGELFEVNMSKTKPNDEQFTENDSICEKFMITCETTITKMVFNEEKNLILETLIERNLDLKLVRVYKRSCGKYNVLMSKVYRQEYCTDIVAGNILLSSYQYIETVENFLSYLSNCTSMDLQEDERYKFEMRLRRIIK